LTRNQPTVEVSPAVITNADPTQPAMMQVTLRNSADTAETEKPWTYVLTVYNIDGLEIIISGQTLFDNILELEAEPITLTMELKKTFGYTYPNSYLIVTPLCEYGQELTRDPLESVAPFTISYMYECAPVRWVGSYDDMNLEKYFLINNSPLDGEKDLLEVIVQNSKVQEGLWTDNPRLQYVVVEYKHEDDTLWSVAVTADLEHTGLGGDPAYLIEGDFGFASVVVNTSTWTTEGLYKIRTRSSCIPVTGFEQPQFLTSSASPRVGLVDRTPPFVLREFTQPADLSFWPGDEIKIRFSETLNCFLPATGVRAVLLFADEDPEDFDTVVREIYNGYLDVMCSDDTLYFSFGPNFDYSASKDRPLTITVSAAQDIAGNVQSDPFTFNFKIEPTKESHLSYGVLGYVIPGSMEAYIAMIDKRSQYEEKRFTLDEIAGGLTVDSENPVTTQDTFKQYFLKEISTIMGISVSRINIDQIVTLNNSLLVDYTITAGSPDASASYRRLLIAEKMINATNVTNATEEDSNATSTNSTETEEVVQNTTTTTSNVTTIGPNGKPLVAGLASSSYVVSTSEVEESASGKWQIFWNAVAYDIFQFLFVVFLAAWIPFAIAFVVYLLQKPATPKDASDDYNLL